jgi:hypothetical protein
MKKYVILFFGFLITFSQCIDVSQIYQGENKVGLRQKIQDNLEKQIVNGLELYRNSNGQYPISNGDKYYLKFLYPYLSISKTYLYQDFWKEGKVYETKGCWNTSTIDTTNLYIGIGTPSNRIEYSSVDGKTYFLKYVIDE